MNLLKPPRRRPSVTDFCSGLCSCSEHRPQDTWRPVSARFRGTRHVPRVTRATCYVPRAGRYTEGEYRPPACQPVGAARRVGECHPPLTHVSPHPSRPSRVVLRRAEPRTPVAPPAVMSQLRPSSERTPPCHRLGWGQINGSASHRTRARRARWNGAVQARRVRLPTWHVLRRRRRTQQKLA